VEGNEVETVEAPSEFDVLEIEIEGDRWLMPGDGVLKPPPDPNIVTRLSNLPSS
jgi:hypothetical protein